MRHSLRLFVVLPALIGVFGSSVNTQASSVTGPRSPVLAAVGYVDDGSLAVITDPRRYRTPVVRRGHLLAVNGWAVDTARRAPAARVSLIVDGRLPILAQYGLPRPDVAKALRSNAYTRSGFSAMVPTGALSPGRHYFQVGVIPGSGMGGVVLPQRLPFVVGPAVSLAGTRRMAARTSGIISLFDWVKYGSGATPVKNKPITMSAGHVFTVAGWAIDVARGRPAGAVFLTVDGKESIVASYGLNRPDVGRVLRNQLYTPSGFIGVVPALSLPRGNHRVTVQILTWDVKAYSQLAQAFQITVT